MQAYKTGKCYVCYDQATALVVRKMSANLNSLYNFESHDCSLLAAGSAKRICKRQIQNLKIENMKNNKDSSRKNS